MTAQPSLLLRGSAVISACERYRYSLERAWDGALPRICWLMLNPSTADADADDPTLRRCMDFSASWGFGSLVVVNLFAWRSSDPRALRTASDPVGPENDAAILEARAVSAMTLCAWGNVSPALRLRVPQVLELLRTAPRGWEDGRLRVLGLTKHGNPKHPLARGRERVPDGQAPTVWRQR